MPEITQPRILLIGTGDTKADELQKLTDAHIKQVLNYLAASKLRLGLLVNFGGDSLEWKRLVL